VSLAVLAAMLAIGLFGVPLAAVVVKYLRDDEHSELERVADIAAVSVAVRLTQGLDPAVVASGERSARIAVYDPSGRLLTGQGPPVADGVVRRALGGDRVRGTDATGELVVSVPIRTDTTVLGVVRAGTPPTEVSDRVGLVWLLMLGLAVVDVLAVWLVARRLAARLSRPLERLARSAHALGDGDFSTRFHTAGITEIDSVAEALTSTSARLSDLVGRERSFSADASHQLRTPLTALQLGLEVALEDPGHDLRAAIVTAVAYTEQLRTTVSDLLALARDSTRRGEPLALEPLLDDLAAVWGPQLSGQGRRLLTRPHPHVPVTDASAAAVRQILAVLLDNATGHGRGTVTVSVRELAGALAIDVADQGPGITVPDAQLFARRGPAGSNDSSGHGIGLALARRLAEAEGGRLRMSKPFPPTFTLLLPIPDDAIAISATGR
jgi:signal transduction histidine kinase